MDKKYVPAYIDIFTKAFDWFIVLYGLSKCDGDTLMLIMAIVAFVSMEYISQVFLTNYVRENIDLYLESGYPRIIERDNRKIIKLIFRTIYLK